MKKFGLKNAKRILASFLITGVLSSNVVVFADEGISTEELELNAIYSQEFEEWLNLSAEEQAETELPETFVTVMTDDAIEDYSGLSDEAKEYRAEILTRGLSITNSVSTAVVKASYSSSSYNLNSDITITVKHQGTTNSCWAFSALSVLETNLALTQNVYKEFSSRHMTYATSISPFTDGTNSAGYNKAVSDGGLANLALAYLTNGQGAVLEEDMPFENNENAISLTALEQDVDTIVTDYTSFPAIYKSYASDGTVTYMDSNGDTLSTTELTAIRNAIKSHIVNYGAITAVTAGNQTAYYNTPNNISQASAYFCNNTGVTRDHAVTIVGWDDNYSASNFSGGAATPTTNGAYIVLNSYGTSNFDGGYLYISYEDVLIETFLYGIQSASNVDYDILYQYDEYGANVTLGNTGTDTIYTANVYTRDASKSETLTYVGVTLVADSTVEVYVNSSSSNTTVSNMTKIASTSTLTAGYHRIAVTETKLTGTSFAIVVKTTTSGGEDVFYVPIEVAISNSIYSTITGNSGKSLYSGNGSTWISLSDSEISGLDMTTADTCIKAFTEYTSAVDEDDNNKDDEEENKGDSGDDNDDTITFTSDTYYITSSDIYKIVHDTTYATFKSNITTNTTYVVYDEDGDAISNNDIIKTGMVLELSDGTEYTLIVRGDTDSTGTISLKDFSRFVSNYSDETSFTLTGAELKAADLSCDGKISLIDLSQMIVLYMSI